MTRLVAALSLMCAAALSASAADSPAASDLERKRAAEIRGASVAGRPLEDRPGSTLKASQLPKELATLPQLDPNDDIKMIRDADLGEEVAVNLTLASLWKQARGGNALDWTGNIAPDVKPGLVIDSQNYKSIAGLELLLPPSVYRRLEAGSWDPIPEIRVGETDPMFPTRPYILATKSDKFVVKEFSVEDWKGGMPFPNAKTGEEALTNYLYRAWSDNNHFKWVWTLYGSSDQIERSIRGQIWAMRFNGRTVVDPRPRYDAANADVLEKIATLIEAPKDVRGIALSRTRYSDMRKTDSLQMYLPALRRLRRLSGRDTQDPLVGTDLIWDDYVGFYQQVTHDNVEVKLVAETEVLHPMTYLKVLPNGEYLRPFTKDNATGLEWKFRKWQRRPVWVVDVISKDPSYVYSRRRLWIDRELPNVLYFEAQDRKGNPWKYMRTAKFYNPTNGDPISWFAGMFSDEINKHRTHMSFEWQHMPQMSNDNFDAAVLTKQTQ